ncbi:hypothetical protein DOT_3331 [Desulfosporosinus sp. OT]|nr:hypothetical protein DOT_3331 [Desulfosporosinus sp. OT]
MPKGDAGNLAQDLRKFEGVNHSHFGSNALSRLKEGSAKYKKN